MCQLLKHRLAGQSNRTRRPISWRIRKARHRFDLIGTLHLRSLQWDLQRLRYRQLLRKLPAPILLEVKWVHSLGLQLEVQLVYSWAQESADQSERWLLEECSQLIRRNP
jgi:hypothetical protein